MRSKAQTEVQVLSKNDLQKGFYQIPMLSDIPKTAFCYYGGKFEFTEMPFGLKNGPTVFERLRDVVLKIL